MSWTSVRSTNACAMSPIRGSLARCGPARSLRRRPSRAAKGRFGERGINHAGSESRLNRRANQPRETDVNSERPSLDAIGLDQAWALALVICDGWADLSRKKLLPRRRLRLRQIGSLAARPPRYATARADVWRACSGPGISRRRRVGRSLAPRKKLHSPLIHREPSRGSEPGQGSQTAF